MVAVIVAGAAGDACMEMLLQLQDLPMPHVTDVDTSTSVAVAHYLKLICWLAL